MPRTKTRDKTPVAQLQIPMSTTPLTQNGKDVSSSTTPSSLTTPVSEEKEKQTPNNPFFKRLKPEYIRTPFPLDFVDMRSDTFCYAKFVRSIIRPLGLTENKDEYMWFVEKAWQHCEQESERETDEEATDMMDNLTHNQRLFNSFRKKWEAAISGAKAT